MDKVDLREGFCHAAKTYHAAQTGTEGGNNPFGTLRAARWAPKTKKGDYPRDCVTPAPGVQSE